MKIESSEVMLKSSNSVRTKKETFVSNSIKNLGTGAVTRTVGKSITHSNMTLEESNYKYQKKNDKSENVKKFIEPEKKAPPQKSQDAEDISRRLQDLNEQIARNRESMDTFADAIKSSQEMIKNLFELFFGSRSERTGIELFAFKAEAFQLNLGFRGVLSLGGIGLSSGLSPVSNLVEYSYFSEGYEHSEENVRFQAGGVIKTSDGREISLSLQFSSRSEKTVYFSSHEKGIKRFVDPLVLNIKDAPAGLSKVRIDFDLDADGVMDNISFAGEGSGFLHLDKNGDGKVNDGSELFGTKSGDGFKDLAAYDGDKNGWIDENDAVFSKLKLWTLDKDGKPSLINLKEAGVGAIYLGRTATKLSLMDGSEMRGKMRASGIYLKENGKAGTINQVDLIG